MSRSPGEWRERYERVERALEEALASGDVSGSDVRTFCPFCTSSKTGRADKSLSISTASGKFWCFRCGDDTKGKLRGYGPQDEDGYTPRCIQVALPGSTPAPPPIRRPQGYTPLGYGDGLEAESLAPARAYAARRGLTPELCAELGVGATLDGFYSGRLIFPFMEPADPDTWWGFVARDYTGLAEKPYLVPKGIQRGARFWNERALYVPTEVPILVVEGYLDAVAYYPDAIPTLGKPTEEHYQLLRGAHRPVVLVPDGDAWTEGWAWAMRLRFDGVPAGYLRLPPKKDPDQLDRARLRADAVASLTAAL